MWTIYTDLAYNEDDGMCIFMYNFSLIVSYTNLCNDPPYTSTVIPTHIDIMNAATVGHLPNNCTIG